jgi:hypothetical protein
MKNPKMLFLVLLILVLGACAGTGPGTNVNTTPPAEGKNVVKEKMPPAPPGTLELKTTSQSSAAKTMKSNGEKLLIFGQTEYITILPANFRLRARIDTGATTSSIHAVNIRQFERDGKKWGRFELIKANGQKVKMERPWIRQIEVKRHGTDQQARPVVSLKVKMGPIKTTTQFSLTDRSQFKFPVLIGRSLLKGIAVVDVNREYVLSPMSGEDHEK